jgi:phosphoribosylanthranilate isomerase
MIRIKICCISSSDEARIAVRLGASALGLVSAMPSGPGPIEEALIAEIARTIPPGIASFLLTSRTSADEIIAQQRRCGTNTLQLVDEVEPGTYQALKRALPGISVVQVIHVVDEASVAEAMAATSHADALLLDSGRPKAAIKELGGTGRVHNWEISRAIVEGSTIPVYLAGGLNAGNVGEAIDVVRPFGVDICSGVRTNGRLDEAKLAHFMNEARSLSASI